MRRSEATAESKCLRLLFLPGSIFPSKHRLRFCFSLLQKLAARAVVAGLVSFACIRVGFSQASTSVTNQYFLNFPTGSNAYKIATLPPGNASDSDHIHIVATIDLNWGSTAQNQIDAIFGNRNGFAYLYSVRGAPSNPNTKLAAYQNGDGSVDIYIMFGAVYGTASYTVLENQDETVYSSPPDTQGTTPVGTLVFDSSSPNYPAATYTDFAGDFTVAGNVQASGSLIEKSIVFTPTTVGWYRVINSNNGTSSGMMHIYNSYYDNTITDDELQFSTSGGVGSSIQQTRYLGYNDLIPQIRASGDGVGNAYLDIYIASAISPTPITIYFYGPDISGVVASPVVGATPGSSGVETLTLAKGIGTTANINVAQGGAYLYGNLPAIQAQTNLSNWFFGGAGGNPTGTGNLNIGIGSYVLQDNTTGALNTAVGANALNVNTTGGSNTATGMNSLFTNTTGSQNTAIGQGALYANVTGNYNTGVGFSALSSATGGGNTALGSYSAANLTTGTNNIALGSSSLGGATTGGYNIAIGAQAGQFIAGGSSANQASSNSIYLGFQTQAQADGDTNETVIGYQAVGNGNNSVTLGSTSVTKTVLQGSVGIGTTMPGTTMPAARLEVAGNVRVSGVGYGIIFPDGSIQSTAFNNQANGSGSANITQSNGDVGIGSSSPAAKLDVAGSLATNITGTEDEFHLTRQINNGVSFAQVAAFKLGTYNTANACCGPQSRLDLALKANADGNLTADTNVMTLLSNGHVGVGTTTPGASLEVNGNMKLTSGSGASLTFADGTVQSTAWNGLSCTTAPGGDYAESIDVIGERSQYEPGDVMVIDPANPEKFLKSSQPYSSLVAGIYSTKPGYVGRRQTTDPRTAKGEIPMAMIGIVPTKVTTENGPIKVGDLLVTSSTTGYAMKGTDRNAMNGAILGKALGKLDSGTGKIEVLVSLQ